VAFGREALASAGRAGTKPDTFDFLGFTHKCARSRRGWFTVHVKTMKKREQNHGAEWPAAEVIDGRQLRCISPGAA